MQSRTWGAAVVSALVLLPGAVAVAGDPGETAIELRDAFPLTDAGDYQGPAWSPDGNTVSVSGPRARGLYAVPSMGGEIRTLAGPEQIGGYRHRWLDQPARILVPGRGAHPAQELPATGGDVRERDGWTEPAMARDDDIFLRQPSRDLRLTQGEDRFFDPVLSADGTRVAFVGLATGIHVMDVERREMVHLGTGTRPCWTPDGAWVVFERTADDGHRLESSQLLAYSVARDETVALTDGTAVDRHPAVSPDGTRLAFIRDGALFVAALAEVAR